MRLLRIALLMAVVFTPVVSSAQGKDYVSTFELGKDYTILPLPQPVEGDKILVQEFFWYGCPHCYHFEPRVTEYLKTLPANVRFQRVAVPGGYWHAQAQAYYTFEQLGAVDKLHNAFFDAWHKKGQQMKDEASVMAFAVEHGINADKFKAAWRSFAVNTQMERAKHQFAIYQLQGVPSLIVDGRYNVQLGAVGEDKAMKVVDFLVKKAAAERKKSAKP